MPLTPAFWTSTITANLTTTGNQGEPRITQLANGNILVSYTTDDQGGAASPFGSDVLGQLFDPLGNRIGVEFRLNSSFSIDNERSMDIAALPGGGFVVVYEDSDPDTGGAISLRIETFDATGAFVQFSDFIDDPSTALPNFVSPAIAVSSATSALVAYVFNFSAVDRDVGIRIYNPTANTFGPQISAFGSGFDLFGFPVLDVTALSNGSYALVTAETVTPTHSRIVMTILDSAGGTVLVPVAVGDTQTNGFQNGHPDVTALTGGFVVTWTERDGSDTDVRAQIFTASGVAVTSQFLVNGFTVGGDDNNDARVVALADGGFIVLYDDDLDPAGRGQRYDAAGVPIGDEFAFDPSIGGGQLDAVLLDDGRVALVWNNGEIRMQILDVRDAPNSPAVYAPDQWQVGTPGDDVFTGAADAEFIAGGAGNDTITAGAGGQTYFGGQGNDTFLSGSTSNTAFGGQGTDTVDFTGFNGAVEFDLASGLTNFGGEIYEGFENVIFGNGANTGIGSNQANTMTGGTGVDTLLGLDGDDLLIGGPGSGGDRMQGGQGNDTLFGGAGADVLDGGSGNDTMDGGLGNDFYLVDSAGDVIQGEIGFAQGGGIDTVRVFIDNFVQPTNIELVRLGNISDTANHSVTGNDAPGTLVGNAGNNRLEGRGGNDQINGNGGNDTLIGGEGRDTLVGGAGADTFVYLAVSNSRTGPADRDVINGFTRAPAAQDRIDLSAIDANTASFGVNDAFTFIGTAAFTAAGQVRIQSLGGPNAVIVEVNVNADLAADMQIFVNLTTTMVAGDFVL